MFKEILVFAVSQHCSLECFSITIVLMFEIFTSFHLENEHQLFTSLCVQMWLPDPLPRFMGAKQRSNL
ncbi:hypothetical protein BLOT_007244 [Blomia tropicalis]|nr:hypothetical protein BLOT_007244 [Blomia tropicalis]